MRRSQLRRRLSKPILDLCLRKSQSRKFHVEKNQELRRRIRYRRAWEQATVPVCGRWRMIATHASHGVSYCGAAKCPELGANGSCRTQGQSARFTRSGRQTALTMRCFQWPTEPSLGNLPGPGTFSRSCREFFPNRTDGTSSPSEKIRRHFAQRVRSNFPYAM